MADRTQLLLRCVLGALYTGAGMSKLIVFGETASAAMARDFAEFVTVFPFRGMGWTPDAVTFQTAVGVAEALGGALLLLGPAWAQRGACLGLMVIMAGAAQTLVQIGKPAMAAMPITCFGLLAWHRHRIGDGETGGNKGDKDGKGGKKSKGSKRDKKGKRD